MDPSERIKGHMNADHQLALIDYLVVYGKVDLSQLYDYSPKITAVDEHSISISYDLKSSKSNLVTFKWSELGEDENIEVLSLKDIKGKLIAMAKYAAAKQGFSHVKITSYPKLTKNTAFMASFFCILIIGIYDLQLLKDLFRGDPITSAITPYFPSFVWTILNFVAPRLSLVFALTYVIHIYEILFILRPKLHKYRVPFPQNAAWGILNFFEGFPLLLQFNELVK